MNSAFSGLPGLPVAVLMASNIASPSLTLNAPGSSQITHGVLTKPRADFALLERTWSVVRVGLWTICTWVGESAKR